MVSAPNALQALQSAEQVQLLDIIDNLRSIGVDRVLSIPQIVVCGDQSSGKSSVLEAIAEIPFPRKENLCTRFATEIIMRRKKRSILACEVIRHRDNSARIPIAIRDLSDLPIVVAEATKLMGLDNIERGQGAFSRDVLRITVEGPSRPQLTIVDLPGLIHAKNKFQTDEDVRNISALVEEYIKNIRTIILPVVSAKNDIANQAILERVRNQGVDPEGLRTLGIIIKPDTVARGSDTETSFLDLAKNEDIEFALGWHVLRNRDSTELSTSYQDRNTKESLFFETTRWSELPPEQLGVVTLRTRLSELLVRHIRAELPGLRSELVKATASTKLQLEKLGLKRSTVEDQKRFIYAISNDFSQTARDAVTGRYDSDFFRSGDGILPNLKSSYRLCAVVARHGLEFAKIMRKQAHKYHFTQLEPGPFSEVDQQVKIGIETVFLNQEKKSIRGATAWVKGVLASTRGTELIGSYNPALVGELYRVQSQNWGLIAGAHLNHVISIVESLCHAVLSHMCPSDVSASYLEAAIDDRLKERADKAKDELRKLLEDERGPPLTLNHYYTMTIQKERKKKRLTSDAAISAEKKQKTTNAQGFGFGPFSHATSTPTPTFGQTGGGVKAPTDVNNNFGNMDPETESETDVESVRLDMDEHSSRDALECLTAYYKVSQKTFIDNVERQVIRRHILNGLEDVFSPMVTASWSDAEVQAAAVELPGVAPKRKNLEELLKKLHAGMEVMRWSARKAE